MIAILKLKHKLLMKIPFIKIPNPDLEHFNKLITLSVNKGHYSNFGPNEIELTRQLEDLIGYKVVCCANATLALDGIHDILFKIHPDWTIGLPAFTFPATHLNCRLASTFGKTSSLGTECGFINYSNTTNIDAAITVAPFGSPPPNSLTRPNVKMWIIDNAAGATPSMDRVKQWLHIGADIVIVSLHATKTLSACEGGFVVFKDDYMYQLYKRYINFGFYVESGERKISATGGSNHKMSELSAAWARTSFQTIFTEDYHRREYIAQKYVDFCNKHNLTFIYSTQAFWIFDPTVEATKMVEKFEKYHIEIKPYYTPLYNATQDMDALTLSKYGFCLPSWSMTEAEIQYILNCYSLILGEHN